MRSSFGGDMTRAEEVRAGFIGCGSHACRNLLPTIAFAPVELAATCDLDADLAGRAARKFGA